MKNESMKPGIRARPAASGKDSSKPSPGSKFSIIDLLMVIAIIVCLVLLLVVPAIQSSRESTRREQCLHNLQRISQAVLLHRNATQFFPTGGWGWLWVGDPDRGTDQSQPGGWAYNILPYMDRKDLHDMGKGANPSQKEYEVAHMIATVLPEFFCPSRRPAVLYPYNDKAHNAKRVKFSAHNDYAINRGDFYALSGAGPKDYDDKNYRWPDTKNFTGISFVRSMIQTKDITDGLSCTYLVGEKHLDPTKYTLGKDPGDNGCVYQGDDVDIARQTGMNGSGLPPMQDTPAEKDYSFSCGFGSAHPSTWQASFCDGSVKSITFDIDPELHRKLGNRKDGEKINTSSVPSE